jgi:hypothetical protein
VCQPVCPLTACVNTNGATVFSLCKSMTYVYLCISLFFPNLPLFCMPEGTVTILRIPTAPPSPSSYPQVIHDLPQLSTGAVHKLHTGYTQGSM